MTLEEFLVPGSWFLVPGSWFLVLGSWLVVGGWWLVDMREEEDYLTTDFTDEHGLKRILNRHTSLVELQRPRTEGCGRGGSFAPGLPMYFN